MTDPEPEPRHRAFEQEAFGLFLHWGLYALLGRGEWALHNTEIKPDVYEALTESFTAESFDGQRIARLASEAGMNYATLTARHHDGFSLYDTRGLSEYDVTATPAGRDLVEEFVSGCRGEGIRPMLYHTTLDWHWGSQDCDGAAFEEYLEYLHASVELLCTEYGELGGFWFDGNWSRDDVDWRVDELYELIRTHQPEALIVNNTGMDARGAVSHAEIDSVTFEQATPEPLDRSDMRTYVCAEMCQTMNQHWGRATQDVHYQSPADIIETLATCRGAGANYLLNVGPTAEGAIPAFEKETLRKVGTWIESHPEPIYHGRPVAAECQGRDFLLETPDAFYYAAFTLSVSGDEQVTLGTGGAGPRSVANFEEPIEHVEWVDTGESLSFTQHPGAGILRIDCSGYPYGSDRVVRLARLTPGS